jgi:hypothetical protein
MKKTTTGLPLTTKLSKLNASAFSGIKKQSISTDLPNSAGINFGLPSSHKSLLQTSSGTDWTQLASRVASGGATSAFSGSSGSGALSKLGLGPLISGIAGLFGGNKAKTLPALQLFQLPNAVNQTVHLSNSAAQRGSSGNSDTNRSTVHVHVQAMDSQSFINRSGDIAKAVKSAMLNSHSLNDVVSEL